MPKMRHQRRSTICWKLARRAAAYASIRGGGVGGCSANCPKEQRNPGKTIAGNSEEAWNFKRFSLGGKISFSIVAFIPAETGKTGIGASFCSWRAAAILQHSLHGLSPLKVSLAAWITPPSWV